MKAHLLIIAACAILATCPIALNAKVFDLATLPKNVNKLSYGDNFSVECRNNKNGLIDHEEVDVDNSTVTVRIPNSTTLIHRISNFGITDSVTQDRFGQSKIELHLAFVSWGQDGSASAGLILSGNRWYSHHEGDSLWTCANY